MRKAKILKSGRDYIADLERKGWTRADIVKEIAKLHRDTGEGREYSAPQMSRYMAYLQKDMCAESYRLLQAVHARNV